MSKPSNHVAVITRTKNRPITLKRAVESVLNQTYQDFIHVIVNDGGNKEEVDDLLASYLDRYNGRLLVIHHDISKGMEAASNAGIRACESTYVAIHDDDDSWHPEFLVKTVAYLESQKDSNIRGVLVNFDRILETQKGDTLVEVFRNNCRGWIRELTLWNMCKGNFFPPIAMLYRRDVYDVIGGVYDESLPVLGDWEFNLRFLQYFDISYLDEVLALYHHRTEAHSSYSNSLIGGLDKHVHYNKVIRDRFLREDLQKNSLGLGYILNYLHDKKLEEERQLPQTSKFMRNNIIPLIKRNKVLYISALLCKRFVRIILEYTKIRQYGRA